MAGLAGEHPTELLSAMPSPVHLTMALGGALAAGLGTLATASLIGYSPTRLTQLFEEQGAQDATASTAGVERHHAEFLVVSSLVTAGGWILGIWSLTQAFAAADQGLAILAFLLLMLWLGASVPIGFAQLRPERTLLFLMPALQPLRLLLRWPVVLPVLTTTRLLLGALQVRPPEPADAAEMQKQVFAAVADTVTEDTLPQEERTWIGNIIGLKELQVSTLMTPRPDIVAFPETLSLREAVQKALEHGFSRYPVYRERIDEVVGIFYVKDALRLLQADADKLAATPVSAMLREVRFVPETTGAAKLLRRFQGANQHMAIVIDEYGTTVGLVTVEDVLEAIVGDIGDEYDPPSQTIGDADQIRVVESGRVLELPARTPVAEINKLLGSELPEQGDYETVAGLVIARLNHIPVVDETVVIDGVEFRVLQADERRIRRLRATALQPEPAEDA